MDWRQRGVARHRPNADQQAPAREQIFDQARCRMICLPHLAAPGERAPQPTCRV